MSLNTELLITAYDTSSLKSIIVHIRYFTNCERTRGKDEQVIALNMIVPHTLIACRVTGGLAETQHAPIIQNPDFRGLGGNLTHRANVAQTHTAIIIRAFVDITSPIHGSFCSGYQTALTPHRC